MSQQWSRRSVMGAAAAALAAPALAVAADTARPAAKGKLTDDTLGALLKAMGVEAKRTETRYDFDFKSIVDEEEWVFSMSSVLSKDGSSIWIMAWLDELPKSPTDVPRTALLRLLSDNDKLGEGTFFAYIATNRRFVLQRVIPNENISTAAFRGSLDKLSAHVADTYAHWSVANWSNSSQPDPATVTKSEQPVKGSNRVPATRNGKPLQQTVNEPKFKNSTQK
jgi:hypothetical protein